MQYCDIYFNYLVRMKRQFMESIIEVLPFLLGQTIKEAIQAKFINHELPLNNDKILILFSAMVFRELYGYETSELSLKMLAEKYMREEDDRNKNTVGRKITSASS